MTGAKTSNLQQNADFRVLTHSYMLSIIIRIIFKIQLKIKIRAKFLTLLIYICMEWINFEHMDYVDYARTDRSSIII